MGIDIEAGGRVKSKARVTKSANPYIRLLCKLYKFLARRTDSKFNKVIFKRLNMTRKSKPPLSLQKLAKLMAGKDLRSLDDTLAASSTCSRFPLAVAAAFSAVLVVCFASPSL
mmetsp:Transcript_118248/g.376948  ORF Transcript_118248/g.376948 Transcript_118248/m.376948 type:complete len:113 (-) Transcript_118248:44-382(-)